MARDVPDNATLVVAAESDINPESNLVWGAAAIGRVVNRTPEQVRRLHQAGFFGNAVWKAHHRTLVGSVPKLRSLGSV
jgi:G:T-mismatch repair DNA endonuclease (very short patch repair protein)